MSFFENDNSDGNKAPQRAAMNFDGVMSFDNAMNFDPGHTVEISDAQGSQRIARADNQAEDLGQADEAEEAENVGQADVAQADRTHADGTRAADHAPTDHALTGHVRTDHSCQSSLFRWEGTIPRRRKRKRSIMMSRRLVTARLSAWDLLI